MKRIIPFFVFSLLLFSLSCVFKRDDVKLSTNAKAVDCSQEISFVLDGVNLTLTTPFLPDSPIILPEAGDPTQVANIVQREPTFKALTITAIPYGMKQGTEIFAIAEPGKSKGFQDALKAYRQKQQGIVMEGPTATLFDQEVTGIMSIVDIYLDIYNPKPVHIVEWVFEGGNRLWVLRMSKEISLANQDFDSFSCGCEASSWSGITLTSTNLNAPSLTIQLESDYEVTLQTVETQYEDLPFPSWWNGDCDKNTYFAQTGIWSYPLGGSFRGVKACGPRPWADDAPHAFVQFFPGSWGALEWECVELSMRFMYLAYGIPPYKANGNQVVTNYNGAQLTKINNGTVGIAPQPNDIMSSGPETTYGHTVIVSESNVDGSGNGTIKILEQNASANGTKTYSVVNWEVLSYYTVIGWLHDPTSNSLIYYFPLITK